MPFGFQDELHWLFSVKDGVMLLSDCGCPWQPVDQRRFTMKYLTLILTLVLTGGLLITSQAVSENLSGEQLHQWKQIQERMDTDYQMQKLQLSMGQITEMQRLLSVQGYDLGYDRGALSGVLDEETKAAIGAFQQDHGLAVTNMPNEETMRALERTGGYDVFFGLSPEFDSTGYTNDTCCP